MANRLLTQVERRYSQTEREALSIVWACEHFRVYLFVTELTIETDHKPLEVLYSPNWKSSARIERWVLRLQPFKYRIKYIRNKVVKGLLIMLTGGKNKHRHCHYKHRSRGETS